MSTYPPGQYPYQTPVSQGPSGTAIAGLVLAVIAIIVIIVVIYIFTRDTGQITNRIGEWRTVAGGSSVTTFTGDPNTIYVVPANTADYTLNISPYANISTFVTSSTTTVFRIDNSQNSAGVVKIGGVPVVIAGPSTPSDVPKNSVYEYHWATPTSIKLIGWSKP